MKRGSNLVVLLLVVTLGAILSFTACKKPVVKTIVDGFTQGTTYRIVVIGRKQMELRREIDSLLKIVDNSMSLYDPQSLICRVNRNETDRIDSLMADCIDQAALVSSQSEGLYDITIKPLTAAYGFTGDGITQQPNVDSLLQFVGYKKIDVANGRIIKADPRTQIDLNSIAQGATSDYIANYFDSRGFTDYLIEIGGEIYTRGLNLAGKPWVVWVDRPEEGNMTPGANLQVKIGLSNEGLATSGNYRKFYTDNSGRKIVHTVNPVTGEPVISNLLSATVVAKTSTLADAYGTMFMVMGLEKSIAFLEQHDEIAAYLVYSDENGELKIHVTPNMNSKIVK